MYVSAKSIDGNALAYYRKTDAEEIAARFFVYKFDE